MYQCYSLYKEILIKNINVTKIRQRKRFRNNNSKAAHKENTRREFNLGKAFVSTIVDKFLTKTLYFVYAVVDHNLSTMCLCEHNYFIFI